MIVRTFSDDLPIAELARPVSATEISDRLVASNGAYSEVTTAQSIMGLRRLGLTSNKRSRERRLRSIAKGAAK